MMDQAQMDQIRFPVRRLCPLALATCAVLAAGPAVAQRVVELTPNLVSLPASDLSLVVDAEGREWLRFATTSWNNGRGPLEVAAGPVETGSGKQQIYQVVYSSDGGSTLHYSGSMEYHEEHDHIHFNDFALYTLQPMNASGGSSRAGAKTTFCIMDNTRVDTSLPGASDTAFYTSCNKELQGMSVGWGDTYGAHLDGQAFDFSDYPDGIYRLGIEIDPKKLLVEQSKSDNMSCLLLSVTRPNTVTVLDNSGSCTGVTSISPDTARMGTSVQATISGFGFVPGMKIRFEGGNGPRPVASDVVLVSDTDTVDTISATITVPYKKQPGRDPLWNLRVGGSVLADGFLVTP
jgi:hypothetical protein